MQRNCRVTILSTADWDASIWTNKQHIARRLAERGWETRYVESLGLRRPRLTGNDLYRGIGRLRKAFRGWRAPDCVQKSTGDVVVISPILLPAHGISLIRKLNRVALKRSTCPKDRFPTEVLYTFSPETYGLEESFDVTIYHAVDLLHNLPYIDAESILRAERSLIIGADYIAASSLGVEEHLSSQGARDILYWPNVADVELFKSKWGPRSPKVIFAGNLTPTKIETEWILSLANRGVRVEVVGPFGIDGTSDSATRRLVDHSNVVYHGSVSQSEMSSIAGTCTVGIIPYRLNEYTAGVFPMKVFEYLAAGLGVVSSMLPSLRAEATQDLHLCVTESEFVATVLDLLPIPDELALNRRFESAQNRSWSSRIDSIESILSSTR